MKYNPWRTHDLMGWWWGQVLHGIVIDLNAHPTQRIPQPKRGESPENQKGR